jgi:hypothetical protein
MVKDHPLYGTQFFHVRARRARPLLRAPTSGSDSALRCAGRRRCGSTRSPTRWPRSPTASSSRLTPRCDACTRVGDPRSLSACAPQGLHFLNEERETLASFGYADIYRCVCVSMCACVRACVLFFVLCCGLCCVRSH